MYVRRVILPLFTVRRATPRIEILRPVGGMFNFAFMRPPKPPQEGDAATLDNDLILRGAQFQYTPGRLDRGVSARSGG